MGVISWLIDKSALVRVATAEEAELWAERTERGEVAVTMLTRLEVGSRPGPAENYARLRADARVTGQRVERLPVAS